MAGDAGLFLDTFTPDLGSARRAVALAVFPALRHRVRRDFKIDEAGVADSFERLRLAGDRFQSELEPSGYLVGGELTVADLTLAALISPIVAPSEFPYPQPQRDHPLLAPVRDVLAESGLLAWTRQIYKRHRGSSAEIET